VNIVADSNIPYAAEACDHLGDVEVVEASELSPERLRDCDALLCRSTRRIDAELLDGTRVRFVATATIGTDHMDFEYLRRRGIATASAPGSNANSVSEYITSVLLVLAEQTGRHLREMTLGVVGVGNVGGRVVRKAEALGITVLQNDPPLRRRTGEDRFRPLDELMDCDVISFHVPLTREGEDATFHMVDAARLGRLRPGAILLNSSRGAVVDEAALHEALDAGRLAATALDVWEHEPSIDTDLLDKVDLATPHIAGHSFDGKVNGTRMVYEALCRFLGVEPTWDPASALPPPDVPELSLDASGRDEDDVIREAVTALYDVRRDDAALRQTPRDESRREYFSSLRRNYWPRRAFHHTRVTLADRSPDLTAALTGLGFRLRA
jgi:erythronate-4-phosphate dehydrogenase